MRSRICRIAAVVVALATSMTMRPQAQTVSNGAAPFDIIGVIDAATLTPEADHFSGGRTITVNCTTIIVPKHALLQMPAFALTWQEIFELAPAPWKARGLSGLAKADRDADGKAPRTTYEVRIQGNRVVRNGGEQYIAGLMFIANPSHPSGHGPVFGAAPPTLGKGGW